jgi:hypothetical protein
MLSNLDDSRTFAGQEVIDADAWHVSRTFASQVASDGDAW